jgi:NADH dehydrogenase [ubiquinone] 1 alpha subcomplex assembly factor 6
LHSLQEAELNNTTHMTVEDFTAHAESTTSSLLYLILALLRLNNRGGSTAVGYEDLSQPHEHHPSSDPYDPDTLSHAASHLGVAQSITTLLRAMPYHASKSRMVIPAEITASHNVRQEEVFRRGGSAQGISDAVYEFACLAHGHLNASREMFEPNDGKVPEKALPLFMAGVSPSHRLIAP